MPLAIWERVSHLRLEGTVNLMTTSSHILLTDSTVILDNTHPQCAPISAPTMYYQSTTQLLLNYYFPDLSLLEK